MQEIEVTIRHKVGLHARPAALFVQTASKFKSDLKVLKGEREVNAKSILSVLTLGAGQGAILKLVAEGEDEDQAIEALRLLVEGNFGEEPSEG
ncbi:MAG TPA: HPr family phosphocarrier protein [Anaerolineae bacterium]|nr:HPr family phosphocarrier protein [Anaerolineae bacterium]